MSIPTTRRTGHNPATLTVVTGQPGADLGPVAAYLGRNLRDGLAIRVVDSDARSETKHTSPDPTRPGEAVALSVLPSAWQNPDTNLGVVYTGWVDSGLRDDLEALDRLGLNPAHRLTVQHHGVPRGETGGPTVWVPMPVEIGNLAEHARDSVLRGSAESSRSVLIEAGDGLNILQALSALGLAPWGPHIEHLDFWMVFDADRTADPVAEARRLVTLNGGPIPHMNLAIVNAQEYIPRLAGIDTNGFHDMPDDLGDQVDGALNALTIDIMKKSGVEVLLLGTGGTTILDLR